MKSIDTGRDEDGVCRECGATVVEAHRQTCQTGARVKAEVEDLGRETLKHYHPSLYAEIVQTESTDTAEASYVEESSNE